MFHLASLATPTQLPIASHQRGSWLASRRTISSSVTAQKTKSGVVVVSSCAAATYSAHVAAASAARIWPVRPAPSRRLMLAVSMTRTGSPSAGSTRNPASVPPPATAASRASSGVSAGWST